MPNRARELCEMLSRAPCTKAEQPTLLIACGDDEAAAETAFEQLRATREAQNRARPNLLRRDAIRRLRKHLDELDHRRQPP